MAAAGDPNNLYTPFTSFDFYDYYRDAQGGLVYLKGSSKPVQKIEPKEVDMSTFVPDPLDPGNAPFIFPEGITMADALAAQQARANTVDGHATAAILELAKAALKIESVQAAQVLKASSSSKVMTPLIEGFSGSSGPSRGFFCPFTFFTKILFVLAILWLIFKRRI